MKLIMWFWNMRYRYEVRKKKGNKCLEDMAELIATKFVVNKRVACGIVYCLSRNDCEKVATDLQVMLDDIILPIDQPCLSG